MIVGMQIHYGPATTITIDAISLFPFLCSRAMSKPGIARLATLSHRRQASTDRHRKPLDESGGRTRHPCTWTTPAHLASAAADIQRNTSNCQAIQHADPMPPVPNHPRCPWVDLTKEDYVAYHDLEWGVPLYDDRLLFEFLILEGAQAGLSWYTVLRKREAYRMAFDQFDPNSVARYNQKKIESLMANAGIIRNRQKILAAINNAQRFLDVQEEFGSFSDYMWRFVDGKPIVNHIRAMSDYPTTSPQSDAFSRDLRKRGFSFVGSTICYAHMQATGMVNDHSLDCFRRTQIIEGY